MNRTDEYLETVPAMSRAAIARALAGELSPRQAIKAKCLECCGFDRAEAAACTVWRCPLHAYNPWRPENRRAVAEKIDSEAQGPSGGAFPEGIGKSEPSTQHPTESTPGCVPAAVER